MKTSVNNETKTKLHLQLAHADVATGKLEPGNQDSKFLLNQATMRQDGYPTQFEDAVNVTLKGGVAQANAAFKVFDEAFSRMVKREAEVELATKKHVGVLKERANAVAEALARIDKMAGADFEEKLNRLKRFASAVKVLNDLDNAGRLEAIAAALSKTKVR